MLTYDGFSKLLAEEKQNNLFDLKVVKMSLRFFIFFYITCKCILE